MFRIYDASEEICYKSKANVTILTIMRNIPLPYFKIKRNILRCRTNKRVRRRNLIACFTFQCYRRFLRRIKLLILLKKPSQSANDRILQNIPSRVISSSSKSFFFNGNFLSIKKDSIFCNPLRKMRLHLYLLIFFSFYLPFSPLNIL